MALAEHRAARGRYLQQEAGQPRQSRPSEGRPGEHAGLSYSCSLLLEHNPREGTHEAKVVALSAVRPPTGCRPANRAPSALLQAVGSDRLQHTASQVHSRRTPSYLSAALSPVYGQQGGDELGHSGQLGYLILCVAHV